MGIRNSIRESNFELLRMVSMFMIVVLHIGIHGLEKQVDLTNFLTGSNEWLYYFVRSLSIVAVSLYVLLSGYFLSKSKSTFKFSKLVKLFLETSFFSLVVYFLNIFAGFAEFKLANFSISSLSVFYQEYWFISVYFVLYAIYPFLNRLLENITKREHVYLLTIFFLLACIWNFVDPTKYFGVSGGYSLIYFIFLYYLAAYIRFYGHLFRDFHKSVYLISYIGLAIANGFLLYYDVQILNMTNWYSYNSPIVLLMTYSLFMFFKHLNIKSKVINFSSYYVLGVYLIHEQHIFRGVLWGEFEIIEGIIASNGNFVIPVMLGYSLIVFVSCLLASIVIKTVFDKVYNLVCSSIKQKISKTSEVVQNTV